MKPLDAHYYRQVAGDELGTGFFRESDIRSLHVLPNGEGADVIVRVEAPMCMGFGCSKPATRYQEEGFEPYCDDCESFEKDPNGCAECARANGPHYTGPCNH